MLRRYAERLLLSHKYEIKADLGERQLPAVLRLAIQEGLLQS
jgi:hypothetical protein